MDEETICRVCERDYSIKWDHEDDGFCHDCAHELAAEATEEQIERVKERVKERFRPR